jgi:hypothetical protein
MREERAVLGLGTPARKASAEFGADTPVAVLDEETTADRINKSPCGRRCSP